MPVMVFRPGQLLKNVSPSQSRAIDIIDIRKGQSNLIVIGVVQDGDVYRIERVTLSKGHEETIKAKIEEIMTSDGGETHLVRMVYLDGFRAQPLGIEKGMPIDELIKIINENRLDSKMYIVIYAEDVAIVGEPKFMQIVLNNGQIVLRPRGQTFWLDYISEMLRRYGMIKGDFILVVGLNMAAIRDGIYLPDPAHLYDPRKMIYYRVDAILPISIKIETGSATISSASGSTATASSSSSGPSSEKESVKKEAKEEREDGLEKALISQMFELMKMMMEGDEK